MLLHNIVFPGILYLMVTKTISFHPMVIFWTWLYIYLSSQPFCIFSLLSLLLIIDLCILLSAQPSQIAGMVVILIAVNVVNSVAFLIGLITECSCHKSGHQQSFWYPKGIGQGNPPISIVVGECSQQSGVPLFERFYPSKVWNLVGREALDFSPFFPFQALYSIHFVTPSLTISLIE